jgi:hypothetical protein
LVREILGIAVVDGERLAIRVVGHGNTALDSSVVD